MRWLAARCPSRTWCRNYQRTICNARAHAMSRRSPGWRLMQHASLTKCHRTIDWPVLSICCYLMRGSSTPCAIRSTPACRAFQSCSRMAQYQTYDLAELGRYYRHYERVMDHWRRVLPAGRILDVRYEDVVADLAGQARRMIAHCGLDWHDRCLAFHETGRPVHTASTVQVRQPIYRSAVGRARRFVPYIQPLLDALSAADGTPPAGVPPSPSTAYLGVENHRQREGEPVVGRRGGTAAAARGSRAEASRAQRHRRRDRLSPSRRWTTRRVQDGPRRS